VEGLDGQWWDHYGGKGCVFHRLKLSRLRYTICKIWKGSHHVWEGRGLIFPTNELLNSRTGLELGLSCHFHPGRPVPKCGFRLFKQSLRTIQQNSHPSSLMAHSSKPHSSLFQPPPDPQTDGRPHVYASGLPRVMAATATGFFVRLPRTRGRMATMRNMTTTLRARTAIAPTVHLTGHNQLSIYQITVQIFFV
jgi:hypothetical protein